MNTCPHCRAFFPLEEKVCPHCGTSIVPKLLRERGGLFDRFVPKGFGITAALITVNALLYVASLLWQGGAASGMGGVSPKTVLTFGGLVGPLVLREGEWYRLICPIFLHYDVIHIGFNCLVIWMLGRAAEFAYGPAKYLTLYLVCGIVASLSSAIWHANSPVVAAGASGAAFGLFGLVGVYAWRRGLDDVKRSVIQWTLINLVIGFSRAHVIDNSAHVGGLVAGILLGLAVRDAEYTRLRPQAVRAWDAGAVLSIAAVVAAFATAFVSGGVLGRG